MTIGEVVHGFALRQRRHIQELGVTGLLFEHRQSGARLLKLEAADDNKSFTIVFQTPPEDDTGAPHILEHSVLDGSERFPVKSPFAVLARGSLHTFLNAMTSSDNTMYPVASRNAKDFRNLIEVYLDAVFFPRIYAEPRIFQQEGWHLELDRPDGELRTNGVVFSEMKGAFSSPMRELFRTVSRSLFPDNTYAFSSGGYPPAIPTLTYEQFLSFHERYYHPSNCFIVLYGDGDTEDELAFLSKTLDRFERRPLPARIRWQRPFGCLRRVEAEYPIASGEPTLDQTYLALGFVAPGSIDPTVSMALDVLAAVLANTEASPVRRALAAAGIGRDSFALHWTNQQAVFLFTAKNANPPDAERFQEVIFGTLAGLTERGIDKRLVEGALNRMEFSLREADYGGYPTGLVHTYRAVPGFLFSGDPFLTLEFERPLQAARQALTHDLLERLIDRTFLQNSHSVLCAVKPSPTLAEANQARERDRHARLLADMSPTARLALVEATADLRRFQSEPDPPEALAQIPMLSLDDLDRQAQTIALEHREIAGRPLLWHPAETRQIAYLDLLFSTAGVPQELIPYLPLLGTVLGELDTEQRRYTELSTEINIHTGGIHADLQNYLDRDGGDRFEPMLVISAKSLMSSLDTLLNLEAEILLRTRFDDPVRLAEVLHKHRSRLQTWLKNGGSEVAVTRLESYYSAYGRYQELTGGLTYCRFVADLVRRFGELAPAIVENLRRVAEIVFQRQNLTVALTSRPSDLESIERRLPDLVGQFGDREEPRQRYHFPPGQKNEGLMSASEVQYVVCGADFQSLGHRFTGKLNVLRQVLSRGYLHETIRVQGGAYGAWAWFSRSGLAYFGSYRDPNLRETLERFQGIGDHLKEFEASDPDMTRYIIGTISREDQPLSPAAQGRRAVANLLRRISPEDEQREREEILETRPQDLRVFAGLVRDILRQGFLCVYGSEGKIRENQDLFEAVVSVGD